MASRRVESRRLVVLLSWADAAGRESAGNSPRGSALARETACWRTRETGMQRACRPPARAPAESQWSQSREGEGKGKGGGRKRSRGRQRYLKSSAGASARELPCTALLHARPSPSARDTPREAPVVHRGRDFPARLLLARPPHPSATLLHGRPPDSAPQSSARLCSTVFLCSPFARLISPPPLSPAVALLFLSLLPLLSLPLMPFSLPVPLFFCSLCFCLLFILIWLPSCLLVSPTWAPELAAQRCV